MSSSPILSTESRAILAPLGVEPLSNGCIRVPKAVVSHRQDELLWHEFEDIPEIRESIATLRVVGFTEQAASAILHRWWFVSVTNPDREIKFFDCMTGHIHAYPDDAWALREDWNGVLKGISIRKGTRERILDPEFTSIRLTNTAKGWAVDTIEIRWRRVCDNESHGEGKAVSHPASCSGAG
jgi:hypothetical protein